MASETPEESFWPSRPVPSSRLHEIVTEACDATFASVSSYSHAQTSAWNTSIINKTLQALISASSTSGQPPPYKFAVTSTVIQHITPARASTVADSAAGRGDSELPAPLTTSKPPVGRRGMHSATGAYWDNQKDGMWNFKYEKGEDKGFDVVLSVVWVSMPGGSV